MDISDPQDRVPLERLQIKTAVSRTDALPCALAKAVR
jgi:hypothetical protein